MLTFCYFCMKNRTEKDVRYSIKRAILIFAFFAALGCGNSDTTRSRNANTLTAVFYNVENLYDYYDDPDIDDSEYLPQSEKKWDEKRYRKKLNDLSQVLSRINKKELPEIIGLCEVENRQVVEDLTKTQALAKGQYKIIHYDTPDARGIDVALIYRPDKFTATHHRTLPVILPGRKKPTSRNILYVEGKMTDGETLHVFVNHWPSRNEGLQKSEPNRVAAAKALKSITDSLLLKNPDTNILIMGDMNDTPDNKSLREILEAAHPDEYRHPALVNLMYPLQRRNEGSYNYRGSWDMLDNIIVSSALLNGKGFRVENSEGVVFSEPWMTYENQQGQNAPNRTYSGPRYIGGISDHFPVFCRLVK